MRISLIAAVAHNYVIGDDGDLPWHLPSDLKWFKSKTYGKPVIFGRKTFESLSGPLKGRDNIVLTRQRDYAPEGVTVAHSTDDALKLAGQGDPEEVMILGGSTIYEAFMPFADRFYLTVVHGEFEGDTRFPTIDIGQWEILLTRHQPADDKNAHAHTFVVLERISYGDVIGEAEKLPERLRSL